MFNTFNMGVGMTIAVAKADADAALALLREGGEPGAYILGEIVCRGEAAWSYGKDCGAGIRRGNQSAGHPGCKGRGEAAPCGQISLVVASRPDAYALERAEKAGVPCAVLRKGKE